MFIFAWTVIFLKCVSNRSTIPPLILVCSFLVKTVFITFVFVCHCTNHSENQSNIVCLWFIIHFGEKMPKKCKKNLKEYMAKTLITGITHPTHVIVTLPRLWILSNINALSNHTFVAISYKKYISSLHGTIYSLMMLKVIISIKLILFDRFIYRSLFFFFQFNQTAFS